MALDMSNGNPQMDYAQLDNTYKKFILFTKISIVSLVVLLSGMAFFLT